MIHKKHQCFQCHYEKTCDGLMNRSPCCDVIAVMEYERLGRWKILYCAKNYRLFRIVLLFDVLSWKNLHLNSSAIFRADLSRWSLSSKSAEFFNKMSIAYLLFWATASINGVNPINFISNIWYGPYHGCWYYNLPILSWILISAPWLIK